MSEGIDGGGLLVAAGVVDLGPGFFGLLVAFGIGGVEVAWGADFDDVTGGIVVGFRNGGDSCAVGGGLFGFASLGIVFEPGFDASRVYDLREVPVIVSNGVMDDGNMHKPRPASVACQEGATASATPDPAWEVLGVDHRRYWIRAADARRDGGSLHVDCKP